MGWLGVVYWYGFGVADQALVERCGAWAWVGMCVWPQVAQE